jgi:hypothetical protein
VITKKRGALRPFLFDYLSQQDEPSAGCTQQAPSLSCGVSLGVQQTEASFFGVQQEAAEGSCCFFEAALFFTSTGMSASISIVVLFIHL